MSRYALRIVVAEHQALVLGAIAALLTIEPNLEVVGRALDGDAALALVRTLKPDILLSDMEMPGRSGLEVAAIVAERLRTATVKLSHTGKHCAARATGRVRSSLGEAPHAIMLRERASRIE